MRKREKVCVCVCVCVCFYAISHVVVIKSSKGCGWVGGCGLLTGAFANKGTQKGKGKASSVKEREDGREGEGR